MEGLIKGLIDVALGHGDHKEEDSAAGDRDERSRSTWSEVVSGEQDNDSDRPHQTRWHRQEESNFGRQDWGNVSSEPPRRPQKV
ncbi:hypothetical protein ACLB2K_050005 [Fragaria x ananassa]